MTLDLTSLRPLVDFAFAGGDCAEPLGQVLSAFSVAPSDWEPECFVRHLFVENLVKSTFVPSIDGRPVEIDAAGIERLLSRPPRDEALRRHRQDILRELASSPRARSDLTELYRELRRLRTRLMSPAADGRWEGTRRRLGILESLRAVVERMASAFDGASSRGLASARAFGVEVLASEPFARLVDLLEHERHRADVHLELQLGADGRIRSFVVRRIEERTANRFHRSFFGRLAAKLSLWVRGFRFSDEEVVDRWIDEVFAGLAPLVPGLLQLVGHVELHLAALTFRDRCVAKGLEVSLPEVTDDGPWHLDGLFNPHLLAQGITPVPCTLTHRGAGTTTIVTGPNSGGKTRLLQALGLVQMLAQAGVFVPAASARIRRVPGLFCSLVEEEAFDQREGRLGSELLRIRRVFEKAPPGALVILDELCSGTNPSEGEEIFMLVVALLAELAPETFVTTHFLDFATRLEARASELGLRFLQVELDASDHPTYGFIPGVARTSLAAQAASRLGVTREEILELVRRRRTERA